MKLCLEVSKDAARRGRDVYEDSEGCSSAIQRTKRDSECLCRDGAGVGYRVT